MKLIKYLLDTIALLLVLAIAGADYTNFELHPTLCPDNNLNNCQETVLSIYRGKETLSTLELPVLQ